jgi:HEAT repeat protein
MARLLAAVLVAAMSLWGCERQTPADTDQKSAEDKPAEQVDVDELLEAIEAGDAGDGDRLAAIHAAREVRLEQAAPGLRALLDDADPDVVVAAAAALHAIEGDGAEADVVEAAGRLSRLRHYEQLRSILYVIGDIGGEQADIYLETVAEEHSVPAIRRAAEEVRE